MGVVIEICLKYPGGPTRMRVTDVHPDFWMSIYPAGSIDATRFVFHLCLPPSLANNHVRLLFMRSAIIYYTVLLGI